jgi:hypothetical protein
MAPADPSSAVHAPERDSPMSSWLSSALPVAEFAHFQAFLLFI